ncbi:MAG: DUF1343 domain-containing protein [Saprospiraceae bacterium]|nr:DUF1343 domain-containing protein [Saprospiraceae bacterium]
MKIFISVLGLFATIAQINAQTESAVVVGAERIEAYFPFLKDKQVGFVVNHTSLVGRRHLVDTLHDLGVCVAKIFAPEHGFRGEVDAGEEIVDGIDRRTDASIYSLYGRRKKPNFQDLEGLDVVVFDIQDVGTRFYTYISTMYYVMEACAENGVAFLVLDRPNPNGHLIDGPVLDMRFSSFVGVAPLPVAHGCTVGELAGLFKGECWINKGSDLKLHIVPCLHYHHHRPYELPVKPSPNLPSLRAVLLYPSLCLFEGSTCSVGRGTDWPFEVVGHPDFGCNSFTFIPQRNAGNKNPLHENWVCKGWDFRQVSLDSLYQSSTIRLDWLLDFYEKFPNKPVFFRTDKYLDLLAGTDQLRKQISDGCSEAEIRYTWANDLLAFKAIRSNYLLYP